MAIERIGPDGTIFEFEEGTSEAIITRTIQRHYGTTYEAKAATAGAAAWAETTAGVRPERSVFARWSQDFSDTVNRSWIAEGWRAGNIEGARLQRMTADPNATDEQILAENARLENAGASASQDFGRLWGMATERLTGRGVEMTEEAIEEERARRAAFAAASAADPWYRADGWGSKILHGTSALTSTLAGAALDPVSYVTGGQSLIVKAGVTGVASAASDVMAQQSGVDAGLQSEYQWEQTALSAAAGAGFQGLLDGTGRLISRKPGTVIPDRPEAIIREELDAADLLDNVPLSSDDFAKPVVLAEANNAPRISTEVSPDTALARIDEPAADGPGAGSAGPDADPEAGRQLDLFGDPKAGAAPERDPWADVDWNDIASPARKEAAVRHWEALKKFIKPEDAQRFVRWIGGESVDRSEGNHWNKDFFDFSEMRSNPEQFEELADTLAAVFRPLYEESGNITKTWASVAERQQIFGIKMSDAIKAHADITSDHGVSAKIHALETIAAQHTDNLAKLIADTQVKIKKGDLTGVGELASAVQATALFDKMARDSKSEVARALNIMKASKQRTRLINDLQAQMDSLGEALNGQVDPDNLGDILGAMSKAYQKKGAKGLTDEIRKAQRFGIADYVSYYIVVGLLTTPATFMRNVMGSTLNVGWSVADRYVAAAIGKARTALPGKGGSVERVTLREANAYVAGVQTAFADAMAAGFRAFKEAAPITDNRSSVMADNAFIPFAITESRRNTWKQKGLLAVPDILAAGAFSTIRTLGLRPSIATDEFSKVLSRRMQLGALAHREAAYRAARLTNPTDAAKVYKRTVDSIINEPTDEAFAKAEQLFADRGIVEGGKQVFQDDILEEAALVIRSMDIRQMTNDHARDMAFQKIGPKMTKLERAIGQWPIIKALYVPFFRTPVALLRNGMFDHNPLLAMTMKDNREKFGNLIAAQREIDGALQRGGADADMVLAKMATGAGVMGLAYGLWNAGNLTGNLTKAEREDGKQPYSIKIGDTWHSFAQLSPVAEPLGFIADIANAFQEREMSDDQFEALVGGVLTAFTQNIVNKSFLKGLSDLMDMFDGGQPGQKSESLGSTLAREGADKVSGMLIPAIVRNVAQDLDPTWRETDSFIQAFTAKIPFVSDTLPPKRDWLGREVVRDEGQRGIFQAVRSSKMKTELLELEVAQLAKLGEFDLSSPSRRFNEEEITREEQGRVLQIQGQEFRNPVTGENMEEALRALVSSPEYATWQDARRGEAMRDIVTRYRRQANVAIRTPTSPHYMPEMIERTGMAKVDREAARNGWTPEQSRGRARRYGVTPETFDTVMSFEPTVSEADAAFLKGESPTSE